MNPSLLEIVFDCSHVSVYHVSVLRSLSLIFYLAFSLGFLEFLLFLGVLHVRLVFPQD